MSTSKNNLYPGNRSKMRQYLKNEYLSEQYQLNKYTTLGECGCPQFKSNSIQQGYVTPNQSNAMRISQIVNSTLGGRIRFGNLNGPIQLNDVGGIEGQMGGLPKPLRNVF